MNTGVGPGARPRRRSVGHLISISMPPMRFLFIGAAFCLRLASDSPLATDALAFG